MPITAEFNQNKIKLTRYNKKHKKIMLFLNQVFFLKTRLEKLNIIISETQKQIESNKNENINEKLDIDKLDTEEPDIKSNIKN